MQIIPRIPKESARDYALRLLKHNIMNLHVKPGSMVSVWEIAEISGVSRTPIREAMQELEKTGILEVFPHAGSRISYIDYNRIHESCFIRTTLETTVIGEVCDLFSPEHEAAFEDILYAQRREIERHSFATDPTLFLEQDNRFHHLLYSIANKEMTYQTVMGCLWHFDRLRAISFSAVDTQRLVTEHEGIYQAIREGDKRLAKKLTTKHLSGYLGDEEAIRSKYSEYFADAPGRADAEKGEPSPTQRTRGREKIPPRDVSRRLRASQVPRKSLSRLP